MLARREVERQLGARGVVEEGGGGVDGSSSGG